MTEQVEQVAQAVTRLDCEDTARKIFEAVVSKEHFRPGKIPRPVLVDILSRVWGQVGVLLLDDYPELAEGYDRAIEAWDGEGKFSFKFRFATTLSPDENVFNVKTDLAWSVASKDSTESQTSDPAQPELIEK